MAAKKTSSDEPKGYAEAMAELETILREIDSNSVDVDVLSTKVQRASYLVDWCTERITAAQLTIDELVASFEDDDEGFDDDEFEDDDEEDFDDEDDE
ncbi:MAG: exodeoxyribonuclease VII small subunit [Actinobacteria bacterium]|jgi:exodeoxyribonuclease VII small subunit|nr:exodeoxyribonuclease VII small subunit [Actinomycetota bacterium]